MPMINVILNVYNITVTIILMFYLLTGKRLHIRLNHFFVNIQSERELLIEERERELAESRIEIMISQINPHFLYNSLGTIRRLCDIEPKVAKEAIQDFAFFLRANMDSLTNKAPIPFMQELKHVKHSLNLEKTTV